MSDVDLDLTHVFDDATATSRRRKQPVDEPRPVDAARQVVNNLRRCVCSNLSLARSFHRCFFLQIFCLQRDATRLINT